MIEDMFAMPANHTSDEPLLLDLDQKAASTDAVKHIVGSLNWLLDAIKTNTLTKSTRFNGLNVAKSQFERLCDLLGKNEDDAQETILKKSQLRIANDEISRLRGETAKGITVEGMGNKLEELSKSVHYWWKSLGFLTAKGNFQPNWKGADYHAEFSCYLDKHGDFFMDDKPVTAKELKMKTIEELSEITDISQDDSFMDTPRNRQYIIDALESRFPDCRIWAFQSLKCKSGFSLREVDVYIPIQSI